MSLVGFLFNPTTFPLFLQAEVEIQEDAVAPGQKVLIIDDLLATGGKNPFSSSFSHSHI